MYATKRRRRNVKSYKHPPKESQKSNPSKRHRERLNAELENLASLLPFEQNILTKLDKLSILRLAVSFLRIKSYFQANLKSSIILQQSVLQQENERARLAHVQYQDSSFSEGNAIFESLNGFILIVNENSEVFYSSRTVEQFIGFHQSDIIHQSVFELIHSEDREEFKKHLQWNSMLPPDKMHLTLNEVLNNKEYSKYLERNFTVRFRCLLDNTSGFLTLDIVGRLSVLHGQRGAFQVDSNGEIINPSVKTYGKGKNSKLTNNNDNNSNMVFDRSLNEKSEPVLALFGIACPFGPSSLFEIPQRDSLFKSKHKVNLAPISLDSKGKLLLGYSDAEYSNFGGYDLIHSDDLKYYANAHKELLKTGSSGLICYRIQTSKGNWQWLQSSMRIIYKSNKPECTLANHRPLTNDEGEELFYKRGFEFKLPYPYLYDFENNSFANLTGHNYNNTENNNSVNSTSSSLSSSTISTSNVQNATNLSLTQLLTNQAQADSVSGTSNNVSSSSTSTTKSSQSKGSNKTSKSSNSNTKGSKSTKQSSKAQLIQQRAQQHAQKQLSLQNYNNNNIQNYNLEDSNLSNNQNNIQTSYTSYSQNSTNNLNDYYAINCKTEMCESEPINYENTSNKTILHNNGNSTNQGLDYSTLSSSSTSSCSSVSSNLVPINSNQQGLADSISINISSQCYPYGNYFNSQMYPESYTESSKYYSGNNSYNHTSGLFYQNNSHYNYNTYNTQFNSQSNSQINDNISTNTNNLSQNILNNNNVGNSHSNNSSCSSTSSSSSSSSILNNNPGYTDSGNRTLWPSDQMDTSSSLQGYSSNVGSNDFNQYAASVAQHHHNNQHLNQNSSSYNDILANNAAVIAAASYSCATAAAASTYGAYSFNVDDYKPAIPQIPL